MKKYDIFWVEEDKYQKAVGQLRMQLNAVFLPFQAYGLDVFVPGAITEVIKLCEDFSLRVRGVDKPISLDNIRNIRGKK